MSFDHNDIITLGLFAAIFAMSCYACYRIGKSHGIEIGFHMGSAEEHRASLARCIRHKRDSFKLGCITTLARLMGEPTLRGKSYQSPFPVLRSNGGRQDCPSFEDAARNS